jgi:hypothetical protein
MPGWRIAAAAAALLGYALLGNWLMLNAANEPWAVAALFGPLLVAVAGMGWHRRQWATLAACAGLLVLLAVIVWRGGVRDMQRMYVLQHGAIHLALAWSFALTLRDGAKPLITLAGRRRAPQAQAGFHAGHAHLHAGADRRVGRLLHGHGGALGADLPAGALELVVGVLQPAHAAGRGALFVGEHLLRYRRHPEFARVSLRAAFEAYQTQRQAKRGWPKAHATGSAGLPLLAPRDLARHWPGAAARPSAARSSSARRWPWRSSCQPPVGPSTCARTATFLRWAWRQPCCAARPACCRRMRCLKRCARFPQRAQRPT